MRRPSAAVGSAVFFLVAPGTVVGLIPWLLTGWQLRDPGPACAPGNPAGQTNQAHGEALTDIV